MVRPSAETMPSVTVWFNWNGLPIARTHSATFSLAESPHGSTGRPRASILSSARSVHSSVPMIFALSSRLSDMTTDTWARASPTTWLFVRM